jgi:hypothetical protein
LNYIVKVFVSVNGDINKLNDILLGVQTEKWSDLEDYALTMSE